MLKLIIRKEKEKYVPVDDFTLAYFKREIGVTELTEDELSLLQMLVKTPGFDRFTIEVQPTLIDFDNTSW